MARNPSFKFPPESVEYRYCEALSVVVSISPPVSGRQGYRRGASRGAAAAELLRVPAALPRAQFARRGGRSGQSRLSRRRARLRARSTARPPRSSRATELRAPACARAAGQRAECALLYTSGTTGKPKGCLLSNFYFLNVGRRYLDEGGLCALREGEERLITPLPLFHMNALAVSTTAMILTRAAAWCSSIASIPKTWWRDVAARARPSCTISA